jgi:hypothetical protein
VRGSVAAPLRLQSSADWVNAELARFSGNLLGATVRPSEGEPINAVSVYSPAWPVDRSRIAGIDVSAVRLVQNPDVWVADLLWSALCHAGMSDTDRWVIAGDFNSSETFDNWRGGPRGNREYLDRMAALGLVECLRESQGVLTPTFRNSDRNTVKHQIDHLFVTRPLADRLIACTTGDPDVVFGSDLSDHLPVIADFRE